MHAWDSLRIPEQRFVSVIPHTTHTQHLCIESRRMRARLPPLVTTIWRREVLRVPGTVSSRSSQKPVLLCRRRYVLFEVTFPSVGHAARVGLVNLGEVGPESLGPLPGRADVHPRSSGPLPGGPPALPPPPACPPPPAPCMWARREMIHGLWCMLSACTAGLGSPASHTHTHTPLPCVCNGVAALLRLAIPFHTHTHTP